MTAPLLALWAGLALSAPARQASDSAERARVRFVMITTLGTFDRLRGAAQQFSLDLENTSNDLVLVRAARIRHECERADSALADVQRILADPAPTSDARLQVPATRAAATALRAAFGRCTREWGTEPGHRAQPDTLRAWGPYRTNQLEVILRRHAPQIQAFAHAVGADPKR